MLAYLMPKKYTNLPKHCRLIIFSIAGDESNFYSMGASQKNVKTTEDRFHTS